MRPGILAVLLIFMVGFAVGQEGNCRIYRQLLDDHLQVRPPYREITGALLPDCPVTYPTDSLSPATLHLLPAMVTYRRLPRKTFTRMIQIPLAEIVGDSLRSDTLVYLDTLTNANLRAVLAKSPESLQGDDPRAFRKWIKPAIIITSSVAVMLTLFFVRSQD